MDNLEPNMILDFIQTGLKLLNINKHIPVRFNVKRSSLASVAHWPNGHIEIWVSIDNIKNNTQNITWQETIAHELIHVRQVVTGDIVNFNKRFYWKGKDCTEWLETAMFYLHRGERKYYMDLPWEAEAFAGMNTLATEIEEAMNVVV